MMQRDARRVATAYHEAGHAVADYVLGWRLKRVTIRPRGDNYGVSQRGGRRGAAHPKGLSGERYEEWLAEAHCVALICGPAAERLKTGHEPFLTPDAAGHRWVDADGDWMRAERLLATLPDPEGSRQRVMDRLEALILERWPAIRDLAGALLEHRTVGGTEAERVIAHAAVGPGAVTGT